MHFNNFLNQYNPKISAVAPCFARDAIFNVIFAARNRDGNLDFNVMITMIMLKMPPALHQNWFETSQKLV